MADVVSKQRPRYTKLHIGIDIRIVRHIDLRDHRFEAGLIDQKVQVRGPLVVPFLARTDLRPGRRWGWGSRPA